MMSAMRISPLLFLDLPFEIRHLVYGQLLVDHEPVLLYVARRYSARYMKIVIRAGGTRPWRSTSMLCTSCFIYLEAVKILYGKNKFVVQKRSGPWSAQSSGGNNDYVLKIWRMQIGEASWTLVKNITILPFPPDILEEQTKASVRQLFSWESVHALPGFPLSMLTQSGYRAPGRESDLDTESEE